MAGGEPIWLAGTSRNTVFLIDEYRAVVAEHALAQIVLASDFDCAVMAILVSTNAGHEP
jgi:hypothetical protein